MWRAVMAHQSQEREHKQMGVQSAIELTCDLEDIVSQAREQIRRKRGEALRVRLQQLTQVQLPERDVFIRQCHDTPDEFA